MKDFTCPDRVKRYPYPCLWGRGAHCDLAFYDIDDGRTVVVCTDPPDNKHTAVSIVLEVLVPKICRDFDLDPNRLVWIEHYHEACSDQEIFNLITFQIDTEKTRLREPSWRAMKPSDWSELGLYVPTVPGGHDAL